MGFFSKELFGGFFDFNRDGKTSWDEELLACKIIEDCNRTEKESESELPMCRVRPASAAPGRQSFPTASGRNPLSSQLTEIDIMCRLNPEQRILRFNEKKLYDMPYRISAFFQHGECAAGVDYFTFVLEYAAAKKEWIPMGVLITTTYSYLAVEPGIQALRYFRDRLLPIVAMIPEPYIQKQLPEWEKMVSDAILSRSTDAGTV